MDSVKVTPDMVAQIWTNQHGVRVSQITHRQYGTICNLYRYPEESEGAFQRRIVNMIRKIMELITALEHRGAVNHYEWELEKRN